MTAVWYTPASSRDKWLVMAAPGRLLLLEGELSVERRSELWAALHSSVGVQGILDEVARAGISHAPAFGLAAWTGDLDAGDSSLAIIVRGDVSVVAHTARDAADVDGRGVSTWTEQTIPHAVGIQIQVGASRSDSGSLGGGYRLDSGMALSTHVWAGETNGSSPAPEKADSASEKVAQSPSRASEKPAGAAVTAESKVAGHDVPSETTKVDFTQNGITLEEPENVGDHESSGYDHLFGETIVRTVEDAAVRDPETSAAHGNESMNPVAHPQDGDHDGKTEIGLDRATRQAARRARSKANTKSPAQNAPRLFIDLSTGSSEELTQPILIGRAPSVSKVAGASVPRLVTIAGSDQDISRNHVQIAVEGGTVVVTDLHSRNGTMVILPSRPPQQLRAGDPTAVIVGTVVDLGGGVTFTVREG